MLEGYRTIISACVVLLSEALRLSGISVPIGDIEGAANSAIALVGGVAAIWFRIKASKTF